MSDTARDDALQQAILDGIAKYVAIKVQETITRAKEDLDAQIPQMTAAIGIEIQRYFDSMGTDAVVQIRLRPNLKL